jgi:hypothetical protein
MIPIVDVTGIYKFGFGSRSAAIGSLTREISALKPALLVSAGIQQIYKFAGLKTNPTGSLYSKYSVKLRFDHSFIKPAPVITRSIARPEFVTFVKPVSVTTISNLKNVYKFAGLTTVKVISMLNKSILRFDVGSLISLPKITTAKFYRDTSLFKTSSVPLGKIVTFKKYDYVFGDNPSMAILRSNFYGMQTVSMANVTFASLNVPIDRLLFSFTGSVKINTLKFYIDTELFKTSFISASRVVSIKDFRDVFAITSTIGSVKLITISDSRFTDMFNYGSGMNTMLIANPSAKTLIFDYTSVLFTGFNLARILSAPPASWQQNTGSGTYTETLIQFWS